MRTITKTVYVFNELTPAAKERALRDYETSGQEYAFASEALVSIRRWPHTSTVKSDATPLTGPVPIHRDDIQYAGDEPHRDQQTSACTGTTTNKPCTATATAN